MDDLETGRRWLAGTAWLFPASEHGPVQDLTPLPHTPADGRARGATVELEPGRLHGRDRVAWVEGAVTRAGTRHGLDAAEGRPGAR